MCLQEKFDCIINSIEKLIVNKEDDIPKKLAKETGIHIRLIADAFQFITDMTLIKYIRQRRSVNALKLREVEDMSIEEIASEARFSDASAFNKV